MNPYQLLANAIVLQAARDYRDVLRRWKKNKSDANTNFERKELESFFSSGWFGILSDLDGEVLMQKIQEQVLGKAVAV